MIWHNVGHQYTQPSTNTTIRNKPYYKQPGPVVAVIVW